MILFEIGHGKFTSEPSAYYSLSSYPFS